MEKMEKVEKMEMRYDYASRSLKPVTEWEKRQNELNELKFTTFEPPFWKVNPYMNGVPSLYYNPSHIDEELMIYKPSETEVGKGEYYWLKSRRGKFTLEKGHYIYAFGGVIEGFFQYDEKREVASIDEGLRMLVDKTAGEAGRVASEAILNIELSKYEIDGDELLYGEPYEEDYDLDYYERKFEEQKRGPKMNPKRKEGNFPWVRNIRW